MQEIRTSGLMSGEGKRVAHAIPRLSSTLQGGIVFAVATKGLTRRIVIMKVIGRHRLRSAVALQRQDFHRTDRKEPRTDSSIGPLSVYLSLIYFVQALFRQKILPSVTHEIGSSSDGIVRLHACIPCQ